MYYNHEGYKDLTAGIALNTVEKEGKNQRKDKKGTKYRFKSLTFKLGELDSFKQVIK